MGSISTQTDSDMIPYNGISIFLCLIKENHAETQCTLRSMVDVCVDTEELSLETQDQKGIKEAKDGKFREAKEMHGHLKRNKRGRPPKAGKKDNGDISKENKEEGNPNLPWVGRGQRKRKIPSKFESSDFECSLFSNKPHNIEESVIKEDDDETEEEQFVITVNEDGEWKPTEERIGLGRVLLHMNRVNSCKEKQSKVSGEEVIDKAVMTISVHPSDDGHGLTQMEAMDIRRKENVAVNVKRKRKRKTDLEGPFICDSCDLEFEKHNHLVKHKLSHEIAEGKHSVKCEVCGKVLSSQVNLRRHMLIHTGKPFICDKCGKGFTGMYMLSEHKHEDHGEVVPIKKQKTNHMCISCGKYLASKDALKYHRSIPQQCSLCSELYPCKRSLKEHQICVHDKAFQTIDGRIVCTFCKKTFTYRHKYLDHVATHTGEKKYECIKCKKKFISKMSLNYHHKQVHEKHTHRYSCNTCDKVFICNAKLIEHMRTHTGEKPYMCESCGSSFAVKATLRNHMQAIHAQVSKSRKRKNPKEYTTPTKYRYNCPMCHLRDLTSSDLESHCQEEHDALVQFALQEEEEESEDVVVTENEVRDIVVGSTDTKEVANSEVGTSKESITEEDSLCKSNTCIDFDGVS